MVPPRSTSGRGANVGNSCIVTINRHAARLLQSGSDRNTSSARRTWPYLFLFVVTGKAQPDIPPCARCKCRLSRSTPGSLNKTTGFRTATLEIPFANAVSRPCSAECPHGVFEDLAGEIARQPHARRELLAACCPKRRARAPSAEGLLAIRGNPEGLSWKGYAKCRFPATLIVVTCPPAAAWWYRKL